MADAAILAGPLAQAAQAWTWFLSPIADVLPMSPCEIIATVAGLWCVVAYIRQHASAWPTGLVQIVLYLALFLTVGLYADAGLQLVFLALQLHGWWRWSHPDRGQVAVPITCTTGREWAAMAVTVAIAVPCWAVVLKRLDSTVPWWDATPAVLALIAQCGLNRKKLENWLWWIVADLLWIPLYAYKALWLTAGLYVVFLVLAALGFRQWLIDFRASRAA